MEDILYHQVQPENQKTQYKQNDSIDMVLSFEGRSLICNSVRLEADLVVNSTGVTPIDGTTDVKTDAHIGGHSVCQSWTVQFQSQGVVENLSDYPRYVKRVSDSSKTDNDYLNSDMVAELRSPHPTIQSKVILPRCPKEYGGDNSNTDNTTVKQTVVTANRPTQSLENPDFSIKPLICLNKVVSANQRLSYEQTGAIKISVVLERNLGVLWGRGVDANHNYALENVRMCYMSAPDQKPQQVEMVSTLGLKNSLTSATSNIASKVPAVADSMAMSFLRQDQEYALNYNNVALQKIPNLDKISFMFNDSTNTYQSFELLSAEEQLSRGLEGLKGKTRNAMELTKLSSNEAYILGLNWFSDVDLSNQKFNININSDISNLEPFIAYLYFNSKVLV